MKNKDLEIQVEVLEDLTPPICNSVSIITIAGSPIVAVYDYRGKEFQESLSYCLCKFIKNFLEIHNELISLKKEPKV